MTKKFDLDDINLQSEYWYNGDPILFTNPEIRRMFAVASLGEDDVFYDLGSGFAQNVLIALSEFHVKKAVGIEVDRERAWQSRARLHEAGLEKRGRIIRGYFNDLMTERRIREATVIFYGLAMDDYLITRIRRVWKTKDPPRRLIYYNRHLNPKIMPDRVDYPFFVSFAPLRKPKSDVEWLSKVVLQPEGVTSRLKLKRDLDDLWKEFSHNMDVLGIRGDVEDYMNGFSRKSKRRSE
jgi:hypothetical protein